jgi:hypothetical protein
MFDLHMLKATMDKCRIRPNTQKRIRATLFAIYKESRMKKLGEHNKTMAATYDLMGTPWSKCGVLCDMCEQELYAQQGIVLTSHPPKQKVKCRNEHCTFDEGYMIV